MFSNLFKKLPLSWYFLRTTDERKFVRNSLKCKFSYLFCRKKGEFLRLTWIFQGVVSCQCTVWTFGNTTAFNVDRKVVLAPCYWTIFFEGFSWFKVDLFDITIINAISTFADFVNIKLLIESKIDFVSGTHLFSFHLFWWKLLRVYWV